MHHPHMVLEKESNTTKLLEQRNIISMEIEKEVEDFLASWEMKWVCSY